VFETLKLRQRGIFRAIPVPENLVALLAEVELGNDPVAKSGTFLVLQLIGW
jgi:hypothetical protein